MLLTDEDENKRIFPSTDSERTINFCFPHDQCNSITFVGSTKPAHQTDDNLNWGTIECSYWSHNYRRVHCVCVRPQYCFLMSFCDHEAKKWRKEMDRVRESIRTQPEKSYTIISTGSIRVDIDGQSKLIKNSAAKWNLRPDLWNAWRPDLRLSCVSECVTLFSAARQQFVTVEPFFYFRSTR